MKDQPDNHDNEDCGQVKHFFNVKDYLCKSFKRVKTINSQKSLISQGFFNFSHTLLENYDPLLEYQFMFCITSNFALAS